MEKVTNHLNIKARGLEGFTETTPKFEAEKKASLEELLAKRDKSTMATRSAGSGKFDRRARNAAIEDGTQVDFIVIDGQASYVGDIKKDNQMLHPIEDVGMVNVSSGIVVTIDNSRDVVMADIERLIIGDPSLRNRVNFDTSKKMVADNGMKYQINNAKSLSLMTTIPESNLTEEARKLIEEVYNQFQAMHDYCMAATEKSAVGMGPSFKRQTMFLSSKDVLRGLIKSVNPEATDDEVKKTVGQIFASNGVGPLSTMSLDLSFTVTKVIRTKDPSLYPEYSEIDEKNNALRTFVTAFNVSVPINPSVLVEVSTKIERFKLSLISYLTAIHNSALDELAEVKLIPFPDLTVEKHILAGITKEEFSEFQAEVLPKSAGLGVEALRKLEDTRARKRYMDKKEDEESDDFNA